MFFVLLTPWRRVLPEKLTCPQLLKKFSELHGSRKFIAALTRARHLALSCATSIQSKTPSPTQPLIKFSKIHFIIVIPFISLGLPSGLLPSGFPTNTLYTLNRIFCLGPGAPDLGVQGIDTLLARFKNYI
jgi:hypothetical protein